MMRDDQPAGHRKPDGSATQEIALSDITIANRLRPAGEQGVATLLASVEEIGDITDPIHVKKLKKGYRLIDGGHRMEAARRLGRTTIMARIWACTDVQARLMEVDCNLAGAELTALDNALHLAERKRVYEELHPETKRGTAGANARWHATELSSFASATALKFNISDRQVRKIVAVGEALSPREIADLRAGPAAITLKDLIGLSKISEPIIRADVVGALAAGNAKSVPEALARLTPKSQKETDPVEDAFKALVAAWKRAPAPAKRRFAGDIAEELFAILDQKPLAKEAI
jgi:ParB family transcriptional regulator, chromosome partitioning protein